MDCPENENVCSVKKENNLGYYRLHTIWKGNGFFLNVTSKDGAWRGEMTSTEVQKMSSQLNIEPDVYLKECKTALTCHEGQSGMCYAVENGSFVWKKLVDEDSGIKVKMGSVVLEPTSFVDTIQNLVSAALDCNKKLLKEVNELSEEKKKCVSDKNKLLNKLKELVETKEIMEKDLYTRFLLLLNAKKKKIYELQTILEKKKEEDACGMNPYDVDTDADESEDDSKVRKSKGKDKAIKGGSGLFRSARNKDVKVERGRKLKGSEKDVKVNVGKSEEKLTIWKAGERKLKRGEVRTMVAGYSKNADYLDSGSETDSEVATKTYKDKEDQAVGDSSSEEGISKLSRANIFTSSSPDNTDCFKTIKEMNSYYKNMEECGKVVSETENSSKNIKAFSADFLGAVAAEITNSNHPKAENKIISTKTQKIIKEITQDYSIISEVILPKRGINLNFENEATASKKTINEDYFKSKEVVNCTRKNFQSNSFKIGNELLANDYEKDQDYSVGSSESSEEKFSDRNNSSEPNNILRNKSESINHDTEIKVVTGSASILEDDKPRKIQNDVKEIGAKVVTSSGNSVEYGSVTDITSEAKNKRALRKRGNSEEGCLKTTKKMIGSMGYSEGNISERNGGSWGNENEVILRGDDKKKENNNRGSKSPTENTERFPSTKDELLNFFFG